MSEEVKGCLRSVQCKQFMSIYIYANIILFQ